MDQPPQFRPASVSPSVPVPLKKGFPLIGWLGLGCGGLVVIAVIAGALIFLKLKNAYEEFAGHPEKAAAELFVSIHSDLEEVSHDDSKGEMTIRTKTGEQLTLSYKDIANRNFKLKDSDGNEIAMGSGDLSQVPDWVPLPPNHSEAVLFNHKSNGGSSSGLLTMKSSASAADLDGFYEERSTQSPFSDQSSSYLDTGSVSKYEREFSGGGCYIKVIITGYAGQPSLVNIHFEGK